MNQKCIKEKIIDVINKSYIIDYSITKKLKNNNFINIKFNYDNERDEDNEDDSEECNDVNIFYLLLYTVFILLIILLLMIFLTTLARIK